MNFFCCFNDKKNIAFIISLIINIIFLSLTIFLVLRLNSNSYNTTDNSQIEISKADVYEKTDDLENVFVEIKGAVKNPNVYSVSKNSIINDVVKLAGGLNKDAYTKNINLSRKVSNELVIYVYTKNEYKKLYQDNVVKEDTKQVVCETSSYEINNCIDNGISEIIASDNNTVLESNEKEISNDTTSHLVNINTATKEELLTVTGIGESKALAIIKYRSDNGAFTKLEDIKNVSGIGDSLFEKIKNSITV